MKYTAKTIPIKRNHRAIPYGEPKFIGRRTYDGIDVELHQVGDALYELKFYRDGQLACEEQYEYAVALPGFVNQERMDQRIMEIVRLIKGQ